jgi:hypothetical protein
MRYFFYFLCFFSTFFIFPLYAQESLPSSYRGFSLGMSLDELKDALIKDALFTFRGDPDVSFEPSRQEDYVETLGHSFIRRALFQTKEDKVYVMAFTMNTTLMDHYSVFTSLVKKYGEPKSLNPKTAVWEDDNVRLSIERPLTVKYIDKQAFNKVLDESNAQKSEDIRLREDFLNDF